PRPAMSQPLATVAVAWRGGSADPAGPPASPPGRSAPRCGTTPTTPRGRSPSWPRPSRCGCARPSRTRCGSGASSATSTRPGGAAPCGSTWSSPPPTATCPARPGRPWPWCCSTPPAGGSTPGSPPPRTPLPVVLFDGARRRVTARLTAAAGRVRMTDGTEVRIRGRITFYERGGRLQLQMSDIDPDFTLGRLAADRERVLRQLAAEGLLDRQARLPRPLPPLRLGLVTSAGSAAEHAVLDELRASGIGFTVVRADVRVQGTRAPASVARGLRAVAARGVDLVLLVRGGGAATDLAAFDGEVIARAIAELEVPVLTGIGHDIDRSV